MLPRVSEGTSEEAFSSKMKYAKSRLAKVEAPSVLLMAGKLLDEVENFGLSEVVAKIEEVGTPTVSEVTRRRIIAVFEDQPLSTQIDSLELIGRVWPPEVIPP